LKLKTVFEDIEFIVTLEADPDYKEIHRYSQLDIEEDDDIDEYTAHTVLIHTQHQDLDQTFYLYGVYISNDSEDIAEELAEILDDQNIFDLAAREIRELIEKEKVKSRVPHWADPSFK
jgi:hypothetical protein